MDYIEFYKKNIDVSNVDSFTEARFMRDLTAAAEKLDPIFSGIESLYEMSVEKGLREDFLSTILIFLIEVYGDEFNKTLNNKFIVGLVKN